MDDIFLQQMINRLTLGSVYDLIAIGYIMVYDITGMIDFVHGEVYMISTHLLAVVLALPALFGLQNFPLLIFGASLFIVLVTCTYGWVIEHTVYRSLCNSTCLALLVSAIGISLILQSCVRMTQEPRQQGIPILLGGILEFHAGDGFIQLTCTKLFILIVSSTGITILTCVIRYTELGRICRTIRRDYKMVLILGTSADRVTSYVFVIGAAMAALAGMLITMNYGTFDPYASLTIGTKTFTATVFDGIGSLPGAVFGDLVLGVARTQFSRMVNTDYKDVFTFSLLVLILIFRPQSLLGRPRIAKVQGDDDKQWDSHQSQAMCRRYHAFRVDRLGSVRPHR